MGKKYEELTQVQVSLKNTSGPGPKMCHEIGNINQLGLDAGTLLAALSGSQQPST